MCISISIYAWRRRSCYARVLDHLVVGASYEAVISFFSAICVVGEPPLSWQ